MQDFVRSRRGLVASAALVILCIVAFFLVTAPSWRSLIKNAPQSIADLPPQQPSGPMPAGNATTAQSTAAAPGGAPAPDGAPAPSTAAPPAPSGSVKGTAMGSAAGTTPPAPVAGPLPSSTSAPVPHTAPAPTSAPTAVPHTTPAPSREAIGGPVSSASAVPAPAGPAPSAPASPSLPSAPAPSTPTTAPPSSPSGSPAETAEGGNDAQPASHKPAFDIVRVEPTGDSVIAARGAPGSEMVLLDGATPIAHAKADGSGQVAFLPPALKPGEHSLMLSMTAPGGSNTVSSQSVVVSIPAQARTAPMVALIQPNAPAAILSGPVAGGETVTPPASNVPSAAARPGTTQPGATSPTAAPKAPPRNEQVAIRSVEVESTGSFLASGRAPAGSKSRVYLNGAYVATVTADPKGIWSLRINRGMKPGHYEVRADQVEADGKVVARVQVPFEYPEQVGNAPATSATTKKNTEIASAATPEPTQSSNSVGSRRTEGVPVGSGATASATAGAGTANGPGSPKDQSAGLAARVPDAPPSALVGLGGTDPARTSAPAPTNAEPSGLPTTGGTPSLPVTAPPDAASGARLDTNLRPPTGQGPALQRQAAQEAGGSTSVNPGAPVGAASSPPSPAVKVEKPHTETAESGAGDSQQRPSADAVAETGSSRPSGDLAAAPPPTGEGASPTGLSGTAANPNVGAAESVGHGPVASGDASSTGSGQGGTAASGSAAPTNPASGASTTESDEGSTPTVIAELVTTKVIHGDSLWRISRQMLGHGIRYTQIYAANTQEIRDPRLIYPGQVFVLPQE